MSIRDEFCRVVWYTSTIYCSARCVDIGCWQRHEYRVMQVRGKHYRCLPGQHSRCGEIKAVSGLMFFFVLDVVGTCFECHGSSNDHHTRSPCSAALPKVGSFVPADSAEMYCLDGVFTRMGAGDDLAADMSTFMVIALAPLFCIAKGFVDRTRQL